MAEPGFWDTKDKAQADVEKVSRLRGLIEPFRGLETRINDLAVLHEMATEEAPGDARTQAEQEVVKEFHDLEKALDDFEIQCLLGGEFDRNAAYVTIHSGAGGTEACDWADMLMRMYQRWIERHGLKSEILDIQPGDETGVKWATLKVTGDHAYGYLQTERGVHRLVRISPFDSNKRRHTSFASIDITPEIPEDAPIEVEERDLRIDTYRSGGKGGQNDNKV